MSDAAFRKQMDELLSGVEEKRRAEQVAGMKSAQEQMATKEKLRLGGAEKIVDVDTRYKLQELQTKAAMGRLSPEDEYIRSEILRGKKYPDIVREINEAKTGPRAELTREGKLQSAQSEYRKVMSDPMGEIAMKKQGITSLDDFLKKFYPQLAEETSGKSVTAMPDDINALLKKYGGK
jgi:hypothetical protein